MPKRWLRNWQVKVGAMAAAGLLTLGFYGLIEAHPLSGSAVTTTAGAATSDGTPLPARADSSQQAPSQPTPVRRARVSRRS
jgi:hypothetical protein